MIKLPGKLQVLASLSKQKGSLGWLTKFGGLVAVFLVFYIPVYRQYDLVKSNLDSLRDEIVDLKKISASLLTPQELQEVEEHVKDFETKLLESAQASKLLDFISDEADKNHFNVVQIYSDSPVSAKDEFGKDLEYKGKKLMLLPINFRVETDYKSLGNFLKSVKDNIKGTAVVELLTLKRASADSESLQCDITLSCAVL